MGTQTAFLNALDRTDRLLDKAGKQSGLVRSLYENGNTKEAYGQALKMEETAERMVLLARTLPAYTGVPLAMADVGQVMDDTILVEMGFTREGWFALRIPALLPKKQTGSADYIRSFLYPAMRDFFRDRQPVRYAGCVLIYRHVYDRHRPERKPRDHDNIEVNMVSDIVAMYVMPDDGPSVCSHYYCSAAGAGERTEVYVVPKTDFPVWLAMEKMMPDKGVMLYEKRQI